MSEKTKSAMEYNFLGNSGLKVSNICLGTMTFGLVDGDQGPQPKFWHNPTQLDEPAAHKIMDRYKELGGNFIDTANVYAIGNSERIIGTWLKKQERDDFVIATKVRFPVSTKSLTQPNGFGLSRRHIMKSVEDSLSRLQTDYIDLLQAHMWDNGTPVEETLRTFDDLIRCGKIRYYGYSNVSGWQLQKIVETARRLNLNPCITLQQQYNLLQRHSEWEEFMVCENEGLSILPYSPLKEGLLSGKFTKGTEPEESGSRTGYLSVLAGDSSSWANVKDSEQYWKLIDIMKKIGENHDKTVAQVALRWLLQRKSVASVIIGVTSLQHLEYNVGASSGWALSEQEMKELSDASAKSTNHPYDFIWGVWQVGRRYTLEN